MFGVFAAAAAIAVVAAGALGVTSARADTGTSLSLSPSSGSDFTSDAATLSWTVPSACVGNLVEVVLYPGTGAWNATAINTAVGNNGGQTTYYDFYNATASATTGSTSWPNVANGYTDFGTASTPAFSDTGDLVAALGTGYYTIGIACINATTLAPVTDSSGNPVSAYTLVNLGATGNSWAQSTATATQVALSGVGTAGSVDIVALKASVTASNGSVPAGGVNFYAAASATGTPLNGSTPVNVGPNGDAIFIGGSGYPSDIKGAQEYTAVFVPSNSANYVTTSTIASVNLISEAVLIKVTAKQDATTPSSLDVTATAIGAPTNLADLIPGGGVDFIVDGNVYTTTSSAGNTAPFPFNSDGVASTTIAGLASGSHTVTVQLADAANDSLDQAVGYEVLANTVTATTS
jgi:hypothetical protein